MKRILACIFLLVTVCVHAQIDKVIPRQPVPPRLVNDFANILTPEQEQALESKALGYSDSTSTQVAIVTLPTLTDAKTGTTYEDEEVALKILRDWGIGQKGRNNGILILIVKSADDKEKAIRIEVGYGLEGAIPDVTAKAIINNSITPNFRTGNYYRGLDKAIDDIIKAAAGEYKAPAGSGNKKGKGIGFGAIIFILMMIFMFAGRGGGRGGKGGGMVSRRGYGDIGAGWLLGSLLSGGGSGGGGGWSGGGGGGGGFGGFGGGGGGGGGASGSW